MEQLLLYQMDMDGMASWELSHLANVSEVPVPLSESGTRWRMGEAHPVLYQCGWTSMQVQQQSTPCFLHTGN